MPVLLLLLSATCKVAAQSFPMWPSLQDPPLISDGPSVSLDGGAWLVSSGAGVTYPASVPGDLISDLERAGLLRDPLFGQNWRLEARLWNSTAWNYTRAFALPPQPSTLLVFDGIKMAADVYLNGVLLGGASNQHLRYTFEVGALLRPVGGPLNELVVAFPLQSEDLRNDEGRWMACSGGWDWAQISTQKTPGGLPFQSFGIWKSVYLAQAPRLSLRAFKALTFFLGPYPTAPLTDATAGPWRVDVSLYLVAGPSGAQASTLDLAGSWAPPGAGVPVGKFAPNEARTVNASLLVPVGAVKLWWPNGAALPVASPQALYSVTVALAPFNISATRTVGFRSLALVTDDDSSPSVLTNLSGSGNFTLRLRVNGASIFARGSNVIPLDEYAGRASADALCLHLRAAALANMNLLLIWGGGIFQYSAFYACADLYGLLIYQDLMYSAESAEMLETAHLISATPSQAAEIRYNVRRLAHHPSLALWAGGNEIGGGELYASFGLAAVAEEDASRPVWPASPSSGWASGVDRLWGHPLPSEPLGVRLAGAPPANSTSRVQPNVYYMGLQRAAAPAAGAEACGALCGATPGCTVANLLGSECAMRGFGFPTAAWGVTWGTSVFPPSAPLPLPLPPAPCVVETHGPYLGGSGWPAANSGQGTTPTPFDPQVPPALPTPPGPPMGVAFPGFFVSEFGTTAFSSFESMAPTLDPASWGIHGPDMFWRSFSQDNIIVSYFGDFVNRSAVGDAALFARQLLASEVGAALNLKSQIETQRAGNSMGMMLWQLGEIWPTGGWGSLEYAHAHAATRGQVAGGRWKPLHHLLEALLYKDLLVACGAGGVCYARNDDPRAPFTGTATLTAVSVASGEAFALGAPGGVPLALRAGPAAAHFFCATGGQLGPCEAWDSVLSRASGGACNSSSCVLVAELVGPGGAVAARNPTLLAPPSAVMPFLPPSPAVAATLQDPPPPVGHPIAVNVHVSAPVLFLTLTTQAQGHFGRNAELLTIAGNSTVLFFPLPTAGADTYSLLQSTLVLRHF